MSPFSRSDLVKFIFLAVLGVQFPESLAVVRNSSFYSCVEYCDLLLAVQPQNFTRVVETAISQFCSKQLYQYLVLLVIKPLYQSKIPENFIRGNFLPFDSVPGCFSVARIFDSDYRGSQVVKRCSEDNACVIPDIALCKKRAVVVEDQHQPEEVLGVKLQVEP